MIGSISSIPESLITKDRDINMDEILRDNFSNKIIDILDTPKDDNSFNNKITIICHKHHVGVLE